MPVTPDDEVDGFGYMTDPLPHDVTAPAHHADVHAAIDQDDTIGSCAQGRPARTFRFGRRVEGERDVP